MLVRFVVSNFLSFGEEKEFSMLSGSFKTHKHHVYTSGKVDVLKAAAIYGANGAGKSNLIKAINFLKEMVMRGGIDRSVDDKKFKLNSTNFDKPISFEIEFTIEKKIYSYGVSVNHSEIIEEWLYESGVTVDDKLIFERKLTKTGKTSIKMAQKYVRTKKEELLIELIEENLLQKNKLLLGLTEYLKIDEIVSVRNWFFEKLIVIFPDKKLSGILALLLTSPRLKQFFNKLLVSFDTGITEVESAEMDYDKFFNEANEKTNKKEVEELVRINKMLINDELSAVILMGKDGKLIVKNTISLHKNNVGDNVQFKLSEESDGTKRLLDLIPAFDNMLQRDFTYVIDEIDRSLHPSLVCMMVNKIMNDESTKGQLVFTTHESNLLDLDIFRQDEIWFVEKDNKTGSTQIYSLSEFKPRYDLDIRKGYLKGRFGAIPFLANLEDLNWEKYGA
ncbi:MAG TPA: ATP-binding protein [Bacteroidales bacterium]|nr:ATP-binding protein [Bacteroidales bacterium]